MTEALDYLRDVRVDDIPFPDTLVKQALSGYLNHMNQFQVFDILGNGTCGLVGKCCPRANDGITVAIKFQFFAIQESQYFISLLAEGCQLHGIGKVFSHFPVEVRRVKDNDQEDDEKNKKRRERGSITNKDYNDVMMDLLMNAWQILDHLVDVLVALANGGIIHRDMKPINRFADVLSEMTAVRESGRSRDDCSVEAKQAKCMIEGIGKLF